MGSKFKKGDMVVCLKTPGTPADRARGVLENGATKWPVVNGIYTVRALVADKCGPGCLLEGIVNPRYHFGNGDYGEGNWTVRRFRKIRTPDISALRKLVENIPADAMGEA